MILICYNFTKKGRYIKMGREKKDGRYINYYIRKDIYEKLKAYSDEKGQTMTTALERILSEYLKEKNAQHDKGD